MYNLHLNEKISIMLRKFTFLLFLLMVATTIQARHITGKVVDTDHRDLEGATVELLSIADSSVIPSIEPSLRLKAEAS